MVNFIIVTHGEFGAYMVEAAEEIVGRQSEGLRVIGISSRVELGEIRRRISAAVKELNRGNGVVIATDIPGGTPSNIVLPIAKDMDNVAVVSGLNLYMLISGFNRRKTGASAAEIAAKMVADGQKSVQDVKALLLRAT